MSVVEATKPSKEFYDAALPLASHLALLPINSPVHQSLVADLYDIVNDIRDALIVGAKEEIAQIKAIDGYMFDEKKRHRVGILQSIIRSALGGH